jgi:hypothetical protein
MVIFLCHFFLSCEDRETDLFTLPQKSRQELINEGYKNEMFKRADRIDSLDNITYRIDTLDNVFYKTVNDTVVKYIFQDDILESIEVGFRIKDMDSTNFLNDCKKRGFVRADPVQASAQMAFVEPSQKIHYDVYVGKKYVSFVHFFTKPKFAPPPTVDSVTDVPPTGQYR